MKLNIGERLKASKVLPKENDIILAKVILKLQEKLGITADEKKYHNVKLEAGKDGKGFFWVWEKDGKEYDIELNECEIDIIKKELVKLNEAKKIDVNKDTISLYEKIVK